MGNKVKGQNYTIIKTRKDRDTEVTGTIEELVEYFAYTLKVGKRWEHEKGNKKINMNPKTVDKLVEALNRAESNAAANGHSTTSYSVKINQ